MVSALKYPQYRRFWFGNLAGVSGQQMMWLAQGYLVYSMTHSPLYLGYAGLMTAAPAILLNLVGGVLADRLDQRRVIFFSQVASALSVGVLATLIALDLVQVWHILTVAFVSGATQAFNNPARQSIFPQLIDRKDLMNAVALNSVVWQGTRIIAPAAGGLIYGVAGPAATFFLVSASFLPMGFVALSLNEQQRRPRSQDDSMFKDLVEGVGFIRDNFLFAFLIGMSLFSSFFGMGAQQLYPVFARDILDVGASGLGFLYSAGGIGSMLGMLILGSLGNVERKGLLIVGGATAYGGFLVLFALSASFPLSLAAMFLMGAFSSAYMITVQTALQLRVPDQLRGRVMGIYGISHNIGPLGAMQAGALAAAVSAPFAVTVCGFAIMAFALAVAISNREVRRLQAAPTPA